MHSQRIQMAAIIAECGGTAGIVTLEELVEEIVGHLTDEWVTEHPLVEIDEDTMRIDGLMRVDEVNQELGIELPEDDNYETLAGLILYQLCRIPEEGQQFHYGDLDITVQEMKGPKMEKALITKE